MSESESKWIVVKDHAEPLSQEIDAHGHKIIADEPVSLGGKDLGPNPYDLLLAALGACTNMTLRMYAKKKAWPLERIEISLKHEKIHARDCQDCASESGKIDHIVRKIKIEGPLAPEQRERLLEIADRCPVHRSLMSENWIETQVCS